MSGLKYGENPMLKYKTIVATMNITKNLYPSVCIFGKTLSSIIISFDKF